MKSTLGADQAPVVVTVADNCGLAHAVDRQGWHGRLDRWRCGQTCLSARSPFC